MQTEPIPMFFFCRWGARFHSIRRQDSTSQVPVPNPKGVLALGTSRVSEPIMALLALRSLERVAICHLLSIAIYARRLGVTF